MDINCVSVNNGGSFFNRSAAAVQEGLEESTEESSKIRRRSGSWSGVNESEEEIEAMNLQRTSQESTASMSSEHRCQIEQLEERMRRKLRFFFMNPIEKWQAKRRFPYKFIVQVIKIVLVTAQLWLFAKSRYSHVNYTWDNRVAFSHLFLRGWDSIQEVDTYPPATGPLAVYQIDEFYQTIDFAILGYFNLSNAIGPYSYPHEDNAKVSTKLCLLEYKEGTIFGFNESYVFNSEIITRCINVSVANNVSDFSSEQFLRKHDLPVNFSALVTATLEFSVKTVNFKSAGPLSPPDCYQFDIQILFDNADHDGQVLLSLDAEAVRLFCKGNAEYISDSRVDSILRSLINSLVILICSLSLVLCSRAIWRAQQLKWETMRFFRDTYSRELSGEGRVEFINFWYIMIIVNDVLIIIGSAIKEEIERRHFAGDQWNICSVLLGTGNLLVWFGVLRYLGFFKTYNVLILTLKRAAPKVARFLLCALIIYSGFTFCGWLILGPYHMKFRSLSSTSECLFALINGDDMFATFSIMSKKSTMLWWYCRIYLYSFIALFIYVVLSLFISLIMDAYETIKLFYKEGFPKSDLQEFVATCTDSASSGRFRTDSLSDPSDLLQRLWCCNKKPATSPAQEQVDDDEPLIQ